MYKVTCSIFLSWILLVKCVDSLQNVGDFCEFEKSDKFGICQFIDNCPIAIQLLQKEKISPQTCGFHGRKPLVCCEFDNVVNISYSVPPSTTTLSPVQITTKTTPTPIKPSSVGEKSRAKCKEYEKHAYSYPVEDDSPSTNYCVSKTVQRFESAYARPAEFPHMALIGFEGSDNQLHWECSGSLISEQFVLTAAHCLSHRAFGEPRYVRIGDLDLNTDSDGAEPQDFTVSEIFKHPSYKQPSIYNDIGLLKLDRQPLLNKYVRPACLETDHSLNLSEKILISSGWRTTNLLEDNILLKTSLTYYPNTQCNDAYRRTINGLKDGIKNGTQLCAGRQDLSKDICSGDSGSPLQIINENYCMHNIVGVTSFGRPCYFESLPMVFTRISSYIEWIEGVVWSE